MMEHLNDFLAAPCYSSPQRCGSGLTGFSITSVTPMSCLDTLIYRSGTKASRYITEITSRNLVRWLDERADNG